jgi:hypothetical protein
MPIRHVVQAGDCLISLATKAGVPLDRVRQHPDNQELMRKRPNPSLLLPGDEVVIPDLETKHLSCSTQKRHRFVKRVEKAEIRLQINELGLPRSNEAYVVEIDGKKVGEGQTDTEGNLTCQIPAAADHATIILGEQRDRYEVALGHIDPPDTVQGIHQRLMNLGYYEGGVETEYDGESVEAMSAFLVLEAASNRPADDPSDRENRDNLIARYGS